MASSERSRCWCFTHNNYTEEDKEFWKNFNCKYIIFGCETAPTTGTPHLQGYFVFNDAIRFSTLKNKIPPKVAIFKSNGTPEQNRTYCTKQRDVEYFERGDKPEAGRRSDLDACRSMALSRGMRYVSRNFNSQSIRTAEKFLTYNEPQRTWKPYVQWFWGPPGSGKTAAAIQALPVDDETCEKETLYIHNDTKWWDRYDGQPNVILDDLRADTLRFTSLLRILDRYPFAVEVKGGFRQFLGKRIIITSTMHPCEMFRSTGEDLRQITRRIEEIQEFPPCDTVVTDVTEVQGNIKPGPTTHESTTHDQETLAEYLKTLDII